MSLNTVKAAVAVIAIVCAVAFCAISYMRKDTGSGTISPSAGQMKSGARDGPKRRSP